MAYFNPQSATEVVVDASPVGLGAMLVQYNDNNEMSVIALASKSLTPVEQRYSQIEREALGATWGVLHFHLYLFGNSFKIVTDHKPLVPLFNNPHSKPTTRIERWLLKLQQYEFIMEYKPGKDNPSDFMSRHPRKITDNLTQLTEEHVNFVVTNATPNSISLDEIKEATQQDPVLQLAMEALMTNNWHNAKLQVTGQDRSSLDSLHRLRNELSVTTSNVLLRDQRIIIPQSLRKRIVDIAHEGHQGIVKTKHLLREKVWFPGIDKLVENTVSMCLPCQLTTVDNSREPLQMSKLPDGPWREVSVDFMDLPSGEHLLVVYDDYSRYPEVEIVSSTSAQATIPKLDKIFATFGVPEVVRSDNGPPFNSRDFAKFAEYLGFHHRKITPLWPRSNGEVERLMRTLKKTYRTAKAQGTSWKQSVYQFLRNYRATPHSTTGLAPATVLFGRPIKTRLPEILPKLADDALRTIDNAAKSRMATNADKRAKTKKQISVGDNVIVKRDGHVRKDQTPYEPQIYTVTKKNGSMVTASCPHRTITRNTSFFKVIQRVPDQVLADPAPAPAPDPQDPDPDSADEEPPDSADEEPPDSADEDSDNPVHQPRRNPQRNRRKPLHLQDFVP